ncbi:KH domain-containing protein akap-1 [Gonioctena quinquepunctata]|nr:KH domain-containing protein akap-1 [Gonioctena quinquepunctata]
MDRVFELGVNRGSINYLWYKKKRIGVRSDPGDTNSPPAEFPKEKQPDSVSLKEELEEAEKQINSTLSNPTTPRSFSRSLSGVESTPIDIVIPLELRATKSTSLVISDEDLDLEIEKIKSMRNGPLFGSKTDNSPPQISKSKTPSPIKVKENRPVKSKKNQKKENRQQMAQKDIDVVGEKLTSLKLSNNKEPPKKRDRKDSAENKSNREHVELLRQSSERDSANHSPSDVMLASPSLSSISDNHSEGSSDSGKGGSDVATPPPSRTPGIDVSSNVPTLFEFVIPQNLVGKLIGRYGCFVSQIKDKTNATIIVRKHPSNIKLKICSVEGTKIEIDNALKMVRDKFPAKRYPEMTLEPVHFTPVISSILSLDQLYLKLVEGINNDNILSCLVAPNHLFLQHPTHPSFPNLSVLTTYMNACYSETESPLLPNPIPESTVCAAYSVNSWYRAIVLSTDEETETSYVKFLDYGGFAYVENSKLRQIRGDFLLLPFQAAECMLANIKSVNEDGSWPEEAYNLVAEVAKSTIMYTQVADYTEDGIPLVLIYIVVGPQSVIFLNQHLVDNGLAEWIPSEEDAHSQQQDCTEGAVGGVQA